MFFSFKFGNKIMFIYIHEVASIQVIYYGNTIISTADKLCYHQSLLRAGLLLSASVALALAALVL